MKWRNNRRFLTGVSLGFLSVLALSGCELRRQMYDNGKVKPLGGSSVFADGRASRPLVEGTIARGQLKDDELLYSGKVDGKVADLFPFPIHAEDIRRGQLKFNIFCSVCHGFAGRGNGMIVQRGFKHPPSMHDPRLVASPVGHFFDVMTNGWGVMPSYSTMIVHPEDRWAIAAYIRALQLSQNAVLADVAPEKRNEIKSPGQETVPGSTESGMKEGHHE